MSSVGTTEAKIGDLLWAVRKRHETKRKSFGLDQWTWMPSSQLLWIPSIHAARGDLGTSRPFGRSYTAQG